MRNLRSLTILILFTLLIDTRSALYSNKFLMKANITSEEARTIAEKYGFTFHTQVIRGYFVLKRADVKDKTAIRYNWKPDTMKKENPKIKSIKQERYQDVTAHSSDSETNKTNGVFIADPYWPNMWHLHPNREPNMGVFKAWTRGFTGKGVTLAFDDTGIDPTQKDLQHNYVQELAYDFIDDDDDPFVHFAANETSHGTSVAGIAVAEKNDHCIVGIAHGAKFTNLRLLDVWSAPPSSFALAFTYHMQEIDIYSNSFGIPKKNFKNLKDVAVITDAFRTGVTEGRGGKGVIYTLSSGNDGRTYDCNFDIYNRNIYTISVNSVDFDGSPASYAESCTAVMISAFGGSYSYGVRITTTGSNNACTTVFAGTSAACPMVSGIIALTLEANSKLSWRDIQHLIVETASTSNLKNGSFVTNGSGRNVSLIFGFGLINAEAMVTRALTWKTVPALYQYTTKIVDVLQNGGGLLQPITSSFVIRTKLSYVEQIRVLINFQKNNYEPISINLTSPSGTVNQLHNGGDLITNTSWKPLTVHCWGENPNGNWTLSMATMWNSFNSFYLHSWRMYIYGTQTDPLEDNRPKDANIGSPCVDTCWQLHSTCDEKTKLCVCDDGFSNKNGSCVKEGNVGAECIPTHQCTQSNSTCNNATQRCECAAGHNDFIGQCIKDGDYGGRCMLNKTCTHSDNYCNKFLDTCVRCSRYAVHVGNQCVKDGFVGGKCLSNASCYDDDANCYSGNNTCVKCPENHRVVDGQCTKDGSLGGYCSWLIFCSTTNAQCNRSSSRCECPDGLNKSSTFCYVQDGFIGGECLPSQNCFEDQAFCDVTNNTCSRCPEQHSVLDGICVKDGYIGGQCVNDVCFESNALCDISNNSCVTCQSRYSLIDTKCIEGKSSSNTTDRKLAVSKDKSLVVPAVIIVSSILVVTAAVIAVIVYYRRVYGKNERRINGQDDIMEVTNV